MRRVLVVLLIILILAPSVVIADALPEYEPYQADEFPLWTYKIRRAEQIFFGSMMLTIPVTALVYSLLVNNNVVPSPESEAQAYLIQGAIAAGLSLSISITDFIIGEVKNP
ncbi:MAG TPA: hypothetical protein PLX25_02950 [Sphaerochaeta sp.]|nr:hypothetical protein [Sphaerochaeta sp.]